ncbi:unnamed protein product [Boreogadus saida]
MYSAFHVFKGNHSLCRTADVACLNNMSQRLPPLLDCCQEDPSVRWRTSASLHPYSDERKSLLGRRDQEVSAPRKRQKQKSNVSKPQLEDSIRLQVYGHTAIVNAAFSRFL